MKEAVAMEGRDWSELTPVCRTWLDAARDPSSSSLCFLPCPPLSQSLSSSPVRSPKTLAISSLAVSPCSTALFHRSSPCEDPSLLTEEGRRRPSSAIVDGHGRGGTATSQRKRAPTRPLHTSTGEG